MQKLIVSGCSWTAKVCLPNERTWPHLLADKLEMQCINLGAIAAGNEYIFSSILDELVREKRHSKIGLVMAMWSEWTRWDFEQFKKIYFGAMGYPWLVISIISFFIKESEQ